MTLRKGLSLNVMVESKNVSWGEGGGGGGEERAMTQTTYANKK
jgi:hypothetical protein